MSTLVPNVPEKEQLYESTAYFHVSSTDWGLAELGFVSEQDANQEH